MELTVDRTTKTENSTIGKFSIDGEFFSYCLEPKDRGLTSNMSEAQIAVIKVKDKTCIPTGRYRVTKYFSPKHEAEVPVLVDVPGFAFVEIHAGNYATDTDACLLLGMGKMVDMVTMSRQAIGQFYPKFFTALEAGEEVWITYQDSTAN